MASNSTGFPRAGSIQIPIVFSLPAATLAQNTTYFLHGTTTTASNKPLGFPYRVVGLYGTFPAQTNNTTGTVKIWKNTDSGTNDEVMSFALTDSDGADMAYSTTTVIDQGTDVFSATDNMVVTIFITDGTADLATRFCVWVVIEPGEAGR